MTRIAAALVVALLSCGSAGAQNYVRADCRALIGKPPPQDALTAAWYRRFWTGDCGALRGCLAGSPNWNQVVGRLAARGASADRAALGARACRLGARIGLEWTRPATVRRIDSRDLRRFKAALDGAGDAAAGLARVEALVEAKTGR